MAHLMILQKARFFAEGTAVGAWDCLVGCSDGLSKLKNILIKNEQKLIQNMLVSRGKITGNGF